MILTCPVKPLREALKVVGPVAPRSTPRPILSNVRLHSFFGGVVIEATDFEVWCSTQFDVDVNQENYLDILLPADAFTKIVNTLNGSDVLTIESDGTNVRLSCGKDEWELPTADPDEFPAFPESPAESINLTARDFKDAVRRVSSASDPAAREDKFALDGIRIMTLPGSLEFVAYNGQACSRQSVAARTPLAPSEGKPVVPSKVLARFAASLPEDDSDVSVAFDGTKVFLRHGETSMASRLCARPFPAIEKKMPGGDGFFGLDNRSNFNAKALSLAIGKVLVAIDEDTRAGWLIFGDDSLEVRARAQRGKAKSSLAIESVGDSRVCLQLTTLKAVLDGLGDTQVKFLFGGKEDRPLLSIPGFDCVFMPLAMEEF